MCGEISLLYQFLPPLLNLGTYLFIPWKANNDNNKNITGLIEISFIPKIPVIIDGRKQFSQRNFRYFALVALN